MKKKSESSQVENETLPKYDFTGQEGARGKYHEAYRQGHTVKIHEADGTVSIHYFTFEGGDET